VNVPGSELEWGERWADYMSAHARLHLSDGSTLEAGPIAGPTNVGEFPDALGRCIFVITADNPGRDVSDDANSAAHAQLLRRAKELKWDYLDAHGGDPAWTHVEACIAVRDVDVRDVLALGREFGQDAIFEWTPKHWALVACNDGRRMEFSWQSWWVDPAAVGPHGPREQS